MKAVLKFNKVIGIISIILMLVSTVFALILNNAGANVIASELTHNNVAVHSSVAHTNELASNTNQAMPIGSVNVGDISNIVGAQVNGQCAVCGCKAKDCVLCATCAYGKLINKDGTVAAEPTDLVKQDKALNYTVCPNASKITAQGWYQELMGITKIINDLLLPIILILATAGSIFVIILGVQFSKAESADKREEAKKRMINAIIGVVITLLLLILVNVFTANAPAIVEFVSKPK